MSHWCSDIPRDEAVRAAEDGRSGLLPTLEEAIAAVTNHDAPPGARVSDRQCASPADTGANTAGRDMGNGVFGASTAEVLAMHEETVARLTAESEQLAHERDIYISNELSALRSWQQALTERDEARRERDALLESEAWGVNCKPTPAAPPAAADSGGGDCGCEGMSVRPNERR